jgi:hypothetical protein
MDRSALNRHNEFETQAIETGDFGDKKIIKDSANITEEEHEHTVEHGIGDSPLSKLALLN